MALLLSLVLLMGCSGGNGETPVAPASGPDITGSISGQSETGNTSLLGYYDVYVDVPNQTMEIVENRSAAFVLNIIPFLNQMTDPNYGFSFGSLDMDTTDPAVIKVDVEFQWHHPFPTIDQYMVYDFMGVIITNGDTDLTYQGLSVGNRGTDTYMVNADGYTRWFNPTEFTTELIFGWAPGGIQNLAGDATLNPYMAYGDGLTVEGDLWEWLTSGSNNDGFFEMAVSWNLNSGILPEMDLRSPMQRSAAGKNRVLILLEDTLHIIVMRLSPVMLQLPMIFITTVLIVADLLKLILTYMPGMNNLQQLRLNQQCSRV